MTLKEHVDKAERDYLIALLADNHWHVSTCARIAGVYRSQMYRLMHRHGISVPGIRNGNRGNAAWQSLASV